MHRHTYMHGCMTVCIYTITHVFITICMYIPVYICMCWESCAGSLLVSIQSMEVPARPCSDLPAWPLLSCVICSEWSLLALCDERVLSVRFTRITTTQIDASMVVGLVVWDGLHHELHLLSRSLSDTFHKHLKTDSLLCCLQGTS